MPKYLLIYDIGKNIPQLQIEYTNLDVARIAKMALDASITFQCVESFIVDMNGKRLTV